MKFVIHHARLVSHTEGIGVSNSCELCQHELTCSADPKKLDVETAHDGRCPEYVAWSTSVADHEAQNRYFCGHCTRVDAPRARSCVMQLTLSQWFAARRQLALLTGALPPLLITKDPTLPPRSICREAGKQEGQCGRDSSRDPGRVSGHGGRVFRDAGGRQEG